MREETLNYLSKSFFSLLKILDKFKTFLILDHNLEMIDSLANLVYVCKKLQVNKFIR